MDFDIREYLYNHYPVSENVLKWYRILVWRVFFLLLNMVIFFHHPMLSVVVLVKSAIHLIAIPWKAISLFSWVAFIIILSLAFWTLLICVQMWIYFIFPDQDLCILNLKINIFHHIWKTVSHYLFKYWFSPILYILSFWNSY